MLAAHPCKPRRANQHNPLVNPLGGRGAGPAGRIVVVASAGGLFPMPYAPIYAAAKAGLVNFTRSIAPVLAKRGIAISALCPQPADTRMGQQLRDTVPHALGNAANLIPLDLVRASGPVPRCECAHACFSRRFRLRVEGREWNRVMGQDPCCRVPAWPRGWVVGLRVCKRLCARTQRPTHARADAHSLSFIFACAMVMQIPQTKVHVDGRHLAHEAGR